MTTFLIAFLSVNLALFTAGYYYFPRNPKRSHFFVELGICAWLLSAAVLFMLVAYCAGEWLISLVG